MRLAGKVAIVTGAASGIGRAVALAFADEGAKVVCADANAPGAEMVARAIGEAALGVGCDVTIQADVDATIELAVEAFGGLDLLVNAAGIMRAQPMLDITRESFQRVLDVNLLGLFFMLQTAARAMAATGGGRIVNIASIAGRQGHAQSLQYCASKAAVISVTQSAALALAPLGITVNAIAPGYIETAMWEQIRGDIAAAAPGRSGDDFDRQLAATVAAGRLGTPADVTGAAVYLASEAARYVIGQTLNVDGGVTMS